LSLSSSSRRARTALSLAFTLFFGIVSPLARATNAQTAAPPVAVVGTAQEASQAFVVEQSPEGEVICRDATPAEAERINRAAQVPLHQINHLKEALSPLGIDSASATAGLHINLLATTQLENNPAAKQAFINAAAKWEALITTPVTVNIDVDFGPSAFGTAFPSSNVLGLTSQSGFLLSYSTVRRALVNSASAGEEAAVVGNLPASSLPTDSGSLTNVFVPPSQISALGITLGQTAANPKIGFNSAFGFDFDPTDGVSLGLSDFDSVAVHEIGHALGFVSGAGDGQNDASIWDFYRFRPGAASTANFSSAARAVSPGVDSTDRRVQFNGNGEVELSTGKPDGTGGDGSQSSHWKHDTLNGGVFIGIMDPALRRGEHKSITANDIRAIDFLGYTVAQGAAPGTTIQFASATQLVNETAGGAQITVTRAGTLTGASSVLFKTVDDARAVRCDDTTTAPGVAFARCDYATVVQTVNFAAGEASKTVTVPVIDDSFGEPNENVSLSLSNPTGATLGAQSAMTFTIISNEGPGQTGSNPVDSTDFFVRQQYLDFLSREPDPAGMASWINTIKNCAPNDQTCDRVSVSANFFRSQEFQLKGLFVFKFYKVSFGRMPTYAEIVADMSSVTGDSTPDLIARKAAFTEAFAQRQEFVNSFGSASNQQFVDALMGRYSLPSITTINPASPDDTSAARVALTRADLVSRLNAGTLTRGQAVRAVADSNEVSAAEFNPAFVAMQYFGYLRRDPDQGGYNDWLRTINANPSDTRSMVNGFVNSVEYRLRFGPQ
jgi:hypothetical protein